MDALILEIAAAFRYYQEVMVIVMAWVLLYKIKEGGNM